MLINEAHLPFQVKVLLLPYVLIKDSGSVNYKAKHPLSQLKRDSLLWTDFGALKMDRFANKIVRYQSSQHIN